MLGQRQAGWYPNMLAAITVTMPCFNLQSRVNEGGVSTGQELRKCELTGGSEQQG